MKELIEYSDKIAFIVGFIVYISIKARETYKAKKLESQLKEIKTIVTKKEVPTNTSLDMIYDIDVVCSRLLGYLKSEYPVASVLVWQFGNGQQSISGLVSFKYISCIGEAVAPGRARLRHVYQNRAIYDFVPLLKDIKDNEAEIFEYFPSDYPNTMIEIQMDINGIEQGVECPLHQNLDCGLLSVSFFKKVNLSPKAIESIRIAAKEIYQVILSYQ
jgi:hypothetical protein